jgi:hypothetical protein
MKEENGNKNSADRFLIFQTPIEKTLEILSTNHGEAGVDLSELRRIKIPAGGATAWTLQTSTGEKTVKELRCIILSWHDGRAYWGTPMDSQGNMPPDCYSLDARSGVGNPGGLCSRCPHSHFGPSGERPACKEIRELVVLQENELLPDIVSLPRTSILSSRQYLARLSSSRLSCRGVITKIGLEKTKNNQGIVYSRATFAAGDVLTAEEGEQIAQYPVCIKSSPKLALSAQTVTEIEQAEGEVI